MSTILKVPHNQSRQLYLSYLKTAELSTVVQHCEDELRGKRTTLGHCRASVLRDIRDDAILELRGRQLELFRGPDEF